MKLNPQSKRYLQHFKYLQSIQAESTTNAYTYHPNVLKNLKKSKKTSTNGVNVSKNLELYMKKNNIAVHYMNIYNTDLKVLSTNTSMKVLKNASFIIHMQLDNTPCTLMLYFGNTYFFGNCNTSHDVNTAQFQMGGIYSMGSEEIHDNMHFFQQQRTEETKSIVEFLKELQGKELSEEELFMYSTVINNPVLYKNAYNLTKHVHELISTNKKIHHLITYITNYV
ncbi:hypothetical protein A4_254 [Escherichia phage A4]|nr:hypothetical protein A4_254 [Escherichia phage A4]